jgi:hypothetical protein
MNKIIIGFIALTFLSGSLAANKKKNIDVDTDAFTSETQIMLKGGGSSSFSMVWWIPNEFWDAVLSQDKSMQQSDRDAMLDAMKGTSLLAVVQADISALGAFNYYHKDEIEKNLSISYKKSKGNVIDIMPMQKISSDLEIVLGVFKPILGAAMGNLGNNMHFYVLNDKSKITKRTLNPYTKGLLDIKLKDHNNTQLSGVIEMPIDALFVPRKCPNGKDAHISWNYCPWSGDSL